MQPGYTAGAPCSSGVPHSVTGNLLKGTTQKISNSILANFKGRGRVRTAHGC